MDLWALKFTLTYSKHEFDVAIRPILKRQYFVCQDNGIDSNQISHNWLSLLTISFSVINM